MCEVYRIFSKPWEHVCDFSDQAMLELYYSESYGDLINDSNGFFLGKKWLNVTVAMWKQDIEQGILYKCELYQDSTFPEWWLDKVLRDMRRKD